ncbi:hypothetical protein [Paraflavitalea speifideaquila]|uniref:hypothetical protein n=1 Tax=Paraflavitalea speifideaquila TaxID=3076558 RepID=UPI0028ECB8D0|nr:hypothetical protein [Paraflavitalea speifideiaquila]
MELRELPLTYNLNDNLWNQVLLPEKGKRLLLNNRSVPAAKAILKEAGGTLANAVPKWNGDDVHTLQHAIDQYTIMMDTRLVLAETVNQYRHGLSMAATQPQQAVSLLTNAVKPIQELSRRYQLMKEGYTAAWRRENQEYWLKEVQQPYNNKIADLQQLEQALTSAATAIQQQQAPTPASNTRLDIVETTFSYFQNWMLTGPFPAKEPGQAPGFLYAENKEYNKPPSPGDFTMYEGKTYRWQKFATSNGGSLT